jgi:4-amino-4-deoxy-L-arabinose transferase-like glycosyltransferase
MKSLKAFSWYIYPTSICKAFVLGTILPLVVSTILLTALRLSGFPKSFGGTSHDGYMEIAGNLARGHGFVFTPGGPPVIHRPPLVSILYAPLTLAPALIQQYLIVGLQCLAIGGVCALVFDLVARMGRKERAPWAVLIILLFPWLYWHVMNPMNVVLQMFFIAGMLDIFAREIAAMPRQSFQHQKDWIARALLCGLFAGAACLTHATVLGAIAILSGCLFLGIAIKKNLQLARFGVVGLLAMACVIAPWTWRNWREFRRFMPVSSGAGMIYFRGNVHWFVPLYSGDTPFSKAFELAGMPTNPPPDVQYEGLTDVDTASWMDAAMTRDMVLHPGQFAAKMILNAMELYYPAFYNLYCAMTREKGTAEPGPTPLFEVIIITFWDVGLWMLALTAFIKQRHAQDRRFLAFMLLVIAALVVPYLPFLAFIGHQQYIIQTIPYLSILVAYQAPTGWLRHAA